MKHNLKIFLIAFVIGIILTYIISYKFDDTILAKAIDTKATYFYVGSYNTLEQANNKKNAYQNAIIYQDKGIYKVLIGVYTEEESILLMESYFKDQNINFSKDIMKIDNNFIKECSNLEALIKNGDVKYYANINESILKLFLEYKNLN